MAILRPKLSRWAVQALLGGLLVVPGCMPAQQPERKVAPPTEEDAETPKPTVSPLPAPGPVRVSGYEGQVVLMDFWATWSVPSRTETKSLARVHEAYREKGFTVVGKALDRGPGEEVARRLAAMKLPYPVSPADDAAKQEVGGVRAVPTKFLLDREGRVVRKYEGVVPETELRADIESLLAQ